MYLLFNEQFLQMPAFSNPIHCCWHVLRFVALIILLMAVDGDSSARGQGASDAAENDTLYQGQTLDHWVQQLRRGPAKELVEGGKKMLPVWLAAAKDREAASWVHFNLSTHSLNKAWTGPIYIELLKSSQTPSPGTIMTSLGRRPKIVASVIPDLLALIKAWASSQLPEAKHKAELGIRLLAEQRSLPKETIAFVTDIWPAMQDESFMKGRMLEVLGRTGPEGVEALIQIYQQYQPPIRELRYYAKSVDADTVNRIIQTSRAAGVPHSRLATAMIARLAELENESVDIDGLIKELDRLLDVQDLTVRRYAIEAIVALDGNQAAIKFIPRLHQNLGSKDKKSRQAAAAALATFGPLALPAIRKATSSDNVATRIAVSSAIGKMEDPSPEAIDLLLRLAQDDADQVRRYAVFFLGETHSKDSRVAEALIHALDDPATEVWATRALSELGTAADQAVEILHEKLESDDLSKRLRAAAALWAIAQDVETVLPIARMVARDDQGITSSSYSESRRTVDGKSVAKKHRFRYPLAARAAELLGNMGEDARPAVPELIEMLEHDNPYARHAALVAIGEIGPAASAAIPAIEKLIRDGSTGQTRDILHRIQPQEKSSH